MTVHFDEEKHELKLAEIKRKEEEDLAELLSQRYGLPYLDLSRTPINIDALHVVPEAQARTAKLAVFNISGKKAHVAILTPNNEKTSNVLKELEERGYIVNPHIVSELSLDRAWLRYGETVEIAETEEGIFTISLDAIEKLLATIKSLADADRLIKETIGGKQKFLTTRVLEIMMAGALSLNASDIHLEPEEEYVRLRFRLDGILIDVSRFSRTIYPLLLSRVKLLSGLKLNVHSEAQDGRFSVRVDVDEIEIRTSVLPDKQSESIVMRILNPKQIALPMEDLGIEPRLYEKIEIEISRPNGMLFTTGPTGSGKTTTLYAFLRKIHKPEIKIITIEDPVEYILPGIVQTQVKGKFRFADGLRASLRQDPDIIMVGEVRDGETAEIAINASLTGHLVFSTLHTNNAAGTFPRLIDLGVNPKVISSAVNMALAQRLVRQLCKKCRKQVPLAGENKNLVEKIISEIVREDLRPKDTEYVWEAQGCRECNSIGYIKRIGIFEAILMDDAVDYVIRNNPSENEIERAARPQGILSMQQDGILKVFTGETSLQELSRVIDVNKSW
jgi:type IV pilus assembly protein PilB